MSDKSGISEIELDEGKQEDTPSSVFGFGRSRLVNPTQLTSWTHLQQTLQPRRSGRGYASERAHSQSSSV